MREVSDLYLSALLKLKGHRPSHIKGDGRRAVWVFDPTDQIEADIGGYYDGSLAVRARDLLASSNSLRVGSYSQRTK